MSPRRGLAALVCALAVLLVAAAPSAARDRVPWLGVMADGPLTEPGDPFASEWELIGRSGVGFVRAAFYWNQVAAAGPDAPPDWTSTDQVVADAARQGLDVLPVLVGTPDWAAVTPGEGAVPRDPADYAAFATAAIGRYGPRGTFWRERPDLPRRPLRDWQIWNEPSLRLYWNQPGWARGYTRLLRTAAAAVRRADRGATVVLAGLPNFSWRDLHALYRQGARRAFDVVALHPYTGSVDGVLTIVRRNRKVMRAAGDRRKPIWLTETTWPSSRGQRPNAQGWETTAAGQAARVRQALPRLYRDGRALGVRRVSWYAWATVPDGTRWEAYAGLRELRDGRIVAKPAYRAFVRIVRRLAR